MRFVALTLALAGCHAAAPAIPASSLAMQVALAPAASGGDVALASVAMRLMELRAVSDRSAVDGRAAVTDVALSLGDDKMLELSGAPPGLYSAVDVVLGSSADAGLDIHAVWKAERVHVTLMSTPFDVRCAEPVRLDPGQRARLTVRVDPTSWFAGVPLADAAGDADDAGIVLNADDNRALASLVLANVMASFTLDCTPE